jgi:hypothetical protein
MSAHPILYEQLVAYFLGELDPAGADQIARHVETCDQCARIVSRLELIRATLREDDTRSVPYHTIKRANAIYARYRPAREKGRQLDLRSRPFAFVSGFAMAMIVLIGLGVIIANLDIPQDNFLYPAKVTVQGLQVTIANIGRRMGTGQPSSISPIPVTGRPTVTQVTPPDIVISQIYGGGGNTGAAYTHDFIELFNRGTTTVLLAGWSVQYASATGMSTFGTTPAQITQLPNISLSPGQYLLIQEAKGSGGTTLLPAPDVVDPTPIALSATGGKVVLVNQATPLACNGNSILCNLGALDSIVDIVGYGNADSFDGAGPAPAGSNTTAILRLRNGCTKSGHNSADFAPGVPNPRNTSHVARCSDASGQDTVPAGSTKVP